MFMLLMILGIMWAQTWSNIEDLVQPYDSSAPVNATPALQQVSVCFFCGRLCLASYPNSRCWWIVRQSCPHYVNANVKSYFQTKKSF